MKNFFTFFIALIELSIFSGNAQEEVMKVHALQVNFHEFIANIFGRKSGLKHQFLIESSEGEMNTSPSPASASSEGLRKNSRSSQRL